MQIEIEIQSRLAELEAVNQISIALRAAQTLEEILPLLLDVTLGVVHATQGVIWLYDKLKDVLHPAITRGSVEPEGSAARTIRSGQGIIGEVFATGQARALRDQGSDPSVPATTPTPGGAAVPIRAGEIIIGVFEISVPSPREFASSEVNLLTTLSEIAGIAIQRTTLRQQTERRLEQLVALIDIDRSITSSFDLRLNLGTLLGQVIAQLGVDAADVLVFNSSSLMLEYSVGRGFRTQANEISRVRLGESYAGRAALERHLVQIRDLKDQPEKMRLGTHLAGEDFVCYFAVPLIAKGQIKGVLEVFNRSPLEPEKEWLDFLNALAGQAAIAVDNSTLFEGLERSNTELTLAYDSTIEGWSRALDLRDKETEGHTQRVTELTTAMARIFELGDAELVQVRWGGLLHDMGKMGIPDAILLKPGPLNDEEWVIMRKHPVFAYEMLSPIRYLHSALDIPYCHHEKWDGTGYPRGLKGNQIPLTARIFAVGDVWDALTSDRPYRKAWSRQEALAYLRGQSGKHFDPQVLDVFFKEFANQ
jgi:putative nucleotidyltransferase with HDIG domain